MKIVAGISLALVLFVSSIGVAQDYTIVWTFDSQADTTQDVTGLAEAGELVNAQWTPDGKHGGALELAGDGYLEVPHSDALDIQEAITMEAWVYPTEIAGDKRTVFYKNSYYMQIEPDVRIAYYFYGTNPEGYHYSEDTLSENQWAHMAVVWDGSEVRFYIDGQLAGAAINQTGVGNSRPDRTLKIGGEANDCCPRFFVGKLDEVQLSNFAKTQDEIIASMGGFLSVQPVGKLSTRWASLKSRF